MTDLHVPDKISPEIGWRVWLVVAHEDGLRLHSAVHAKVEWPARRELKAECRRQPTPEVMRGSPADAVSPHGAPDEICGVMGGHGCGIYAARDADGCAKYLRGSYSPTRVSGRTVVHLVYGRVALWGKVIEAARGWRAELAYPVEILVPRYRYVASGTNVGEVRPPGIRLAAIVAGLAGYGVPVILLEAGEEARTA